MVNTNENRCDPFYSVMRARWHGLPANVQGVLLVSMASLILVSMSGMVKILGKSLHSFEIVFFRCLLGLIFMLLLHGRNGFKGISTKRPYMHILRSALGITGMFCIFYSVTHMPLANATAIVFSRPLFIIVLAFLFLGEIVGWRRALATVIGFSGILLISRPGGETFQPVALVATAGAISSALVVIVIKKLAVTERTLVIMFYFSLFTTLLSLIPAFLVWQTPTLKELSMLGLIGFFGVIGQISITHGFSLGEATVLIPCDYLRLVFATLFGIFLFGEIPNIWVIIGAVFIVGSNLYVFRTGTFKK